MNCVCIQVLAPLELAEDDSEDTYGTDQKFTEEQVCTVLMCCVKCVTTCSCTQLHVCHEKTEMCNVYRLYVVRFKKMTLARYAIGFPSSACAAAQIQRL